MERVRTIAEKAGMAKGSLEISNSAGACESDGSYTQDSLMQTPDEMEAIILKKKKILRKIRWRCGVRIAAVVMAAVITFTCVIGVSRVQTTELTPALQAGDILLYLRPGKPVSTDVVLYEAEGAGEFHIGRIQKTQGLPVSMRGDGIPVLEEPFPEDRIKGRIILIIRRRPL